VVAITDSPNTSPTMADGDEVVRFFSENPETFEVLKSLHRNAWLKGISQAPTYPDSFATSCHTRLINLIAESTFELTTIGGAQRDSAKERLTLISHLQDQIPIDKPLPLLWLAG
jgi:hypothetical protein